MRRRLIGLCLVVAALVVVPLAVVGAGGPADALDGTAAQTAATGSAGQFGGSDANTGHYEGQSAPTGDPGTDWTFNVSVNNTGDGDVKDGGFGYMRSGAVVHDGIAYFGDSGHGINQKYLYAVNVSTGELVWRFKPGDTFLGPLGGDVAVEPAVHNGTVYVTTSCRCGNGNRLWAIDAETGTEEWQFHAPDKIQTAPVVENGSVYVGTNENKVYSIDADDGSLEWGKEVFGQPTSPALADGTLYVASNDGGYPGTNTLYALDADTGYEQWNYTYEPSAEVGAFEAPVVANGMVYLSNNLADDARVHAFDADSGTEVWNFSTDGNPDAAPAVAGCTVYVGTSSGMVHALDAANGTQQWNASVPGYADVQPSVASGTVYVGSNSGPNFDQTSNVTALSAADGSQRWQLAFDGGLSGSPTPADGKLVVAEGDRVHAISGQTGGGGSVDYGSCAGARNGTGPTPELALSHTHLAVGESMTFDASPSSAQGTTISTYEFDVDGNGDYERVDSTDGKIEYTYQQAGKYEVAVRVTTADGRNATATRTVTVAPASNGSDAPLTDDWTEFGFDEANTGFNPNTTTPTGEPGQAWSFNVSVENGTGTEIKNGGFGSINSADPVISDGIAYFGDAGHGIHQKYLYAVNVSTGELVWRQNLNADVVSAPAVDNGTVYVGTTCVCGGGNKLWAINATTGVAEWNASLDRIKGSPTVANGTVYVGLNNRSMVAVNAETGTTEWTFDTKGGVSTSPAYDNGTVYVTSNDGGYPGNNYLWAVDADTGTAQWNYTYYPSAEVGSFGSPAVANGRVYLPNNLADTPKVHAFDADTGEQLWNFSTDGNPTGGVAVAGCTVYTATGFGTVHALEADSGDEHWQSTVGGRVNSQVSVANGMVYMTSDNTQQLYALHAGSGQPTWSTVLDGSASTSPAVGDGMVVAGGGDEMMGFAGMPSASGVDYGNCSAPGENEPPVASFTASAVEVTVGTDIYFDAKPSYDPDGNITDYTWTVPNSDEGLPGSNGTVQANQAGEYTVQLVVTDEDGATDTLNRTVFVSPGTTTEAAGGTTTEAAGGTGTATATADGTAQPTTTSGPGFGVAVALAALLAVAALARRR